MVISPNQVKNLRGRYGSAGNKDDRFDAFVLADTLRTDRARLHPLVPDSPETATHREQHRVCRSRMPVTFVPDRVPNVPNPRASALRMLKLSGEVRVAEGPADS